MGLFPSRLQNRFGQHLQGDGNLMSYFLDTNFILRDDGDPTKEAWFQCSGITHNTRRQLTFPDKDGTLALLSDITASAAYFQLAGTTPTQVAVNLTAADGILRLNALTATPASVDIFSIERNSSQWFRTAGDGQTYLASSTTSGILNLLGNLGGTMLKIGTSPSLAFSAGGSAITATLAGSSPHLTLAGTLSKLSFSGVTLIDANMFFGATADITKRVTWLLSGATTGTTMTLKPVHTAARTVTIPDGGGNYTLAGLQVLQSFTRKQTITAGAADTNALQLNYDGTAGQYGLLITDASGSQDFLRVDNTYGLSALAFTLWTGGTIGSGFNGSFNSDVLTANRIWTFPDLTGTILIGGATVQLPNQTGSIGTTTLATSPVLSQWLVNCYLVCTTAGTGSVTVNLNWTDVGGNRQKPICTQSLTTTGLINGATQSSTMIQVQSISNITYSAAYTATGTYALYLKLTKL